MPSHYSRHDERSRSRDRSQRGRSRSRSDSRDRSRRSRRSERRRESDRPRIIRDEFGREMKGSLRSLMCSDSREYQRKEKEVRKLREEKKETKEDVPKEEEYDPMNGFADHESYEIEEGEDMSANLQQLMGFGAFGSTKGKHVADNDSVVNQGTARVVKQYKAMRILNRKAKIQSLVCSRKKESTSR